MTNYEMWVGNKYYSRESYITEAKKMGASKKIGWIPHDLEIGRTRIYLISDMTEVQNMYGNGYRRVWDCGNFCFVNKKLE